MTDAGQLLQLGVREVSRGDATVSIRRRDRVGALRSQAAAAERMVPPRAIATRILRSSQSTCSIFETLDFEI